VQRGLDLSFQLRLVVLDEQQVIAAAITDPLGEVPVGEQRVATDHLPRQRQHPQQPQGGLVLVGLGLDAQLPQHGGAAGDEGCQQVDTRDVTGAAALERLAIDGDGFRVGKASLDPGTEGRLEGVQIDGPEDRGEGGLGRRLLAAEAQSMGEAGAVVAAELGDGLQALHAGEHGDDGEGEDRGQRMDAAAGFAGIGDGGEESNERQAGHETPSSALRVNTGGHTQLPHPCQDQPANSPG
jgi:hypothetical protein